MGRDHLCDLVCIGGDAHVLVERDLAEFGDQARVVLGGEEGGVDAEHLGDAQKHRDRQRAHVVLDLIEIAGRNLEPSSERNLAHLAFGA